MRELILALWTVRQKPRPRRERQEVESYTVLCLATGLPSKCPNLHPQVCAALRLGQRSSLQIITMLRLNDG